MVDQIETTGRELVADDEIHLFYRIDQFLLKEGPETTLGNLLPKDGSETKKAAQVIHRDQVDPIETRYKDKPIWEEVGPHVEGPGSTAKTGVSTDLHPAIADLLTGTHPNLVRRWRLTPHAKQCIETADLRSIGDEEPAGSRSLDLVLSAIAHERLTALDIAPTDLKLSFVDLQLIGFATDVAYLVAQVQVTKPDGGDLTVAELLEATHALSRFNRCVWRTQSGENREDRAHPDNNADERPDVFSLGLLLRRLCQHEISSRILWGRTHSYAYVRLRESHSTEVCDTIAAYLSRRYTPDYAMDMKSARVAWVRDFRNVRHGISDEGFATVVYPQSDGHLPEFLADWRRMSMLGAYSPIALMHLHENWFLTKSRAESVTSEDGADELEKLEKTIEDALVFRLCFRFGSVSDISMQGSFARAIRGAGALNALRWYERASLHH